MPPANATAPSRTSPPIAPCGNQQPLSVRCRTDTACAPRIAYANRSGDSMPELRLGDALPNFASAFEAGNEMKVNPTVRAAKSRYSGAKPRPNGILAVIPESEYELIRPDLETVSVRRDFLLYDGGGRIAFTYFLTSGLASLVVQTSDGR